MFVRLVIPQIDPDSRRRLGVFGASYDLLDDKELADHDRTAIRESLDWFKTHLLIPRHVNPRSIFWFKEDAADCMREIWQLVRVLREYNRHVEMMWTRRPGRIVYEDRLQLAAIPFRETNC